MPLPLGSLLRYWRAALLDAARHLAPNGQTLYEQSRDGLARGRIEGDTLASLWRDAEATMSAKDRQSTKSIQILIAPQVLQPRHQHSAAFASRDRDRVAVWAPARLDRAGTLSIGGAPIIDRMVQEPLASKTMTLTTVAAVDAFLDAHRPPGFNESWDVLWSYVGTIFAELLGGPLDSFVPAGHVDTGAFVGFGPMPINASAATQKLYERLIDADKEGVAAPVLLRRLCAPPAPRPLHRERALARHLGQMSGEYPLNDGQRHALAGVLAAGTGDIVAVNGPPGTGKTTLLQSVVAALWVERAMVKDGQPPVILASSTNNKAITNVLDTFTRATLPAGHPLADAPISKRWLPKLTQYGMFLPSAEQARRGIDPKYAVATCDGGAHPWSGLPGTMESADYVVTAEAAWLEHFALWYGAQAPDLAQAVETLRLAVVAQAGVMAEAQDAERALHEQMDAAGLSRPVDQAFARLDQDDAAMRQRLASLTHIGHRAMRLIDGSLLEILLSWWPAVGRRMWGRAHAYLTAQGLTDPAWGWDTQLTPPQLAAWLARFEAELKHAIARKQPLLAARERCRRAHATCGVPEGATVLEAALDTTCRTGLFHLAARYWEGRWLLEMRDSLGNDRALNGRSRSNCERRWRRFAKLTPCLVATAFKAPALFDCWENNANTPMVDFIDLLIIDEAGQVPSPMGAALHALAKTALVVGDVHQLEPVWGIDGDADEGNLALTGLLAHHEAMDQRGLLAAQGSVMHMARAATSFDDLLLTDHWRCRDAVIGYCNNLAYGGRLRPKRGDPAYPLPALGYAHVPGGSRKAGTSRVNPDEAATIAAWLKRRRAELLAQHDDAANLGAVVAVVTPFKAQIGVLRKAVSAAGLSGEEITIGTVHTLQGAEKPIVVFSPVYGAQDGGSMFFDRGVSMLNVAVSRARESFLVFGDMNVFRADQPNCPSGLLARRLFADPANELTDIDPVAPWRHSHSADTQRLEGLEAHRQTLKDALYQAQNRVLVVSPFLAHAAIVADALIPDLIGAKSRGIRVVVAFDLDLNTAAGGGLRNRAQQAIDALTDTGIEIWALHNAHNKTLAVDESWIVEGSFNWLSAQRDRDHTFHRHEASMLIRGRDAAAYTQQAWTEMEKRRGNWGTTR